MSTISDEKPGEAAPPALEPPLPAAEPPAPKARKPGNPFTRFLDWFWCGSSFRALREAHRLPSARTIELTRRARAALDLARVALEPTRAVEHGPHDALACELCAQAVYWALLARESLAESPAPPTQAAQRESLATLWEHANASELARAAGDEETAASLHRSVAGRSFVDYAEAPPEEAVSLARTLRPFAEALLRDVDSAEQGLEKLWFRRLFRLSLPVVLVITACVAVFYGADRLEQARDIARARPWTASSRWPEGGCLSPAQECPGSPSFFFSTNEEDSPWVEFDLGTAQDVSGLSIGNRKDCCGERAIPLAVEVSLDHAKWKEVVRGSETFRTWKPSFPAVKARWVRLRVARRSFLHLSSVRIFH